MIPNPCRREMDALVCVGLTVGTRSASFQGFLCFSPSVCVLLPLHSRCPLSPRTQNGWPQWAITGLRVSDDAVAALTVRIDSLYDHVHSSARKDYSCKRGLVKLMARRRKMMSYLKRKDFEIYRRVALETGLR